MKHFIFIFFAGVVSYPNDDDSADPFSWLSILIIIFFTVCFVPQNIYGYQKGAIYPLWNHTNYVNPYILYDVYTNAWTPWSDSLTNTYRTRRLRIVVTEGSLPPNMQNPMVYTTLGVCHNYALSGTVNVVKYPYHFQYTLLDAFMIQKQYWEQTPVTIFRAVTTNNLLFIIDDWANSTSDVAHVGYLPIKNLDEAYSTNGYLLKVVDWYGKFYNDKDAFVVKKEDHQGLPFKLKIVCSNACQISVNNQSYNLPALVPFQTNIFPVVDQDVAIILNLTNPSLEDAYYKIRVNRGPPIILIHGITSSPTCQEHIEKREVFCEDLDLILANHGCFPEFLCWDSSKTNDWALSRQLTNLIAMIKENAALYKTNVTIIAHSWGSIMATLCHREYEEIFNDKVDKLVLIGGPLAGAPFANFYCDAKFWKWDLGAAFADAADAYKDAPEMGGAFVKSIAKARPFDNTISLVGMWGGKDSAADIYYDKILMNDLHAPILYWAKKAPYDSISRMTREWSDGFIPYCSSGTSHYFPDKSRCKLVFSDITQGMAHGIYTKKAYLHAENAITFENYKKHGIFHTLMYYLTDARADYSLRYTRPFNSDSGALCREIDVYGENKSRFNNFYALVGTKDLQLLPQDIDDNSRLKLISVKDPEKPYKVLVAPAGSYQVYGKCWGSDAYYNGKKWKITTVFDYNSCLTTSTGTVTITGGTVNINESPLTLQSQ